MRFRCTEPPTLRLTVTPSRGAGASVFRTYTMKCFVKSRRPFRRASTNWWRFRSLALFGKANPTVARGYFFAICTLRRLRPFLRRRLMTS